MFSRLLLLIAVLCVSVIYCDDVTCPDFKSVENFDVGRYLGKWYEVKKLPNLFEKFQVCIEAEYTPIDNSTVGVKNTGYLDLILFKIPVTANGAAFVLDPSKPAELSVSFANPPQPDTQPNYVVLDTDYENYSLVYTCTLSQTLLTGSTKKTVYAWILARDRVLDDATVERLEGILETYGVDRNDMEKTGQDNCD